MMFRVSPEQMIHAVYCWRVLREVSALEATRAGVAGKVRAEKPGRTRGGALGAPTGVLLATGAKALPPAPGAGFSSARR